MFLMQIIMASFEIAPYGSLISSNVNNTTTSKDSDPTLIQTQSYLAVTKFTVGAYLKSTELPFFVQLYISGFKSVSSSETSGVMTNAPDGASTHIVNTPLAHFGAALGWKIFKLTLDYDPSTKNLTVHAGLDSALLNWIIGYNLNWKVYSAPSHLTYEQSKQKCTTEVPIFFFTNLKNLYSLISSGQS